MIRIHDPPSTTLFFYPKIYVDLSGVKALSFTTDGASEGRFQPNCWLKFMELQSIINRFLFMLLYEITYMLIVMLYFVLHTYAVLIHLSSTNAIEATTTSTLIHILVCVSLEEAQPRTPTTATHTPSLP
jgi:hypothetical protein